MKDNKKKLIVVVALALVIVSVGVFQFVLASSPGPAPVASGKKPDKKPQTEPVVAAGPKNTQYAFDLPARDPFANGTLPEDPTAKKPVPPTPPQARETAPPRKREIGGDYLPPVNPNAMGALASGKIGLAPDPDAKFAFNVSGVMLGAKPMAVFTDAQGSQRLVMLGGSLDPDSHVISINKDAVTVRFHGKTLRLTVEGNPNAK